MLINKSETFVKRREQTMRGLTIGFLRLGHVQLAQT